MAVKNLFDPSGLGLKNGNLFGLPFALSECKTVVIPVPWDVTVSYRDGTSRAPAAVLRASLQVDLYDQDFPDAWKAGIYMLPVSEDIIKKNHELREKSKKCIEHLENGGEISDVAVGDFYEEINQGCEDLRKWIFAESMKQIDAGKTVAVLGGDHSVPLGFVQALAKVHDEFSVLHVDAHADLRIEYEGFKYSHASILYNISKIKQVKNITLIGIRDFCHAEARMIDLSSGRMNLFDERSIKRNLFEGRSWDNICDDILGSLSSKVYISFDIDALDPSLCPHTGTPVLGGFSYEQIFYLLRKLVDSKRKIIGFDLCEIGYLEGDDWDANVGARILFRLASLVK